MCARTSACLWTSAANNFVLAGALCGYLFFLLIQYQVSIASKQQELQSLQDQLTAQETTNAELSSTLDQGDSAIIERYAREQGYVRPNERVFVDISGK